MENWTIVEDDKILHRWECFECHTIDYVGPDWYAQNGTPYCPECDSDMEYVRTEINNG